MIITGISEVEEMESKGYVNIGEENGRVLWVNPEYICLKPMRTGKCLMDNGHRGKCTTKVHYR